MISQTGKLTKKEAIKSARDAIIISASALMPQLFEILSITDFGEHTNTVSLVVAMIMPLLNRVFNFLRV